MSFRVLISKVVCESFKKMSFNFVGVILILLILLFMGSYFILFGDLVLVGFCLVGTLNLLFCLRRLLVKCSVKRSFKNSESVKTTFKITVILLEVISNTLLLGGLIINEESLIFMFVFVKFNIYPFVFYSYFANSIDFYYTIFGVETILNYCTLSKVLGILGFFMLPTNYYSILNFSMISLLLLFFFRSKDLQDFFIRLLLLDSVSTLTLLVGGINLITILQYCLISYIFQIKTYKSLEGESSFLGFYSFLTLSGGPIHPLIFLKYLGVFHLTPLYLVYGVLTVMVYIQYLILFLFYVRKFFLKDKVPGFYLLGVIGFGAIGLYLILVLEFYFLETLTFSLEYSLNRSFPILFNC